MFEKAKERMMSQFRELTVSHTAKIAAGTAKLLLEIQGWVSRNCDRQLKAGRGAAPLHADRWSLQSACDAPGDFMDPAGCCDGLRRDAGCSATSPV